MKSYVTPKISLVVLTLLVISACSAGQQAKLEANKQTITRFAEVAQSGDYTVFDEVMLENLVRHSQATPELNIRSREEFKDFDRANLKVFPDQKIIIERMVAEGDYVAVWARYVGTQKGQMGPFPPSGKVMDIDFGAVFRFEEGKIAEIWVTWDNMAALAQLGFWPPPQSEG